MKKYVVIYSGILMLIATFCYILYSNGFGDGTGKKGRDGLSTDSAEKFRLQHLPFDMATDDENPVGLGVEYVEDYVDIGGTKVFYVYAMSTKRNNPPPRYAVLLLHAPPYEALTWKSLGTLHLLAKFGYFPLAIDLPGYGKTKIDKYSEDSADFLRKLIFAFPIIDRPVLVIPSVSGEFGLPFVFKYQSDIRGFITVSTPVDLKPEQFRKLLVPVLAFYGHLDPSGEKTGRIIANAPNSKLIGIENGSHAAYLDDLVRFHKELIMFLDSIYLHEIASVLEM